MVSHRHLSVIQASALSLAIGAAMPGASAASLDLTLQDQARQRAIPIELSLPAVPCTKAPCPVALLSAGYGNGYKEYRFLVEELNRAGWLVVSVDHQLPTDAKLDRNEDVGPQLKAMRRRGVANLRFVQDSLSKSHPGYDWRHVTLIGHSLGGDISAKRASEGDPTITRVSPWTTGAARYRARRRSKCSRSAPATRRPTPACYRTRKSKNNTAPASSSRPAPGTTTCTTAAPPSSRRRSPKPRKRSSSKARAKPPHNQKQLRGQVHHFYTGWSV